MNTARDAMLARIRSALRDVPPNEAPADVPVARDYLHTDPHAQDRVERFVERVREYKAIVHQVAPAALAAEIAAACAARGARRLVVPRDLPADWQPPAVELVVDDALRMHRSMDVTAY